MPEGGPSSRRLALGLMAGTSLDGVDAALVEISGAADQPHVELLDFATAPYPGALRQLLLRVAGGELTTAGEISELNFRLGERFARAALAVCRKARIPASRLAFIGSHGQTIYHRGAKAAGRARGSGASTLQIAETSVIAERTGVPVVADFRTSDIAAGGQGAPLVPLVDYLLLRHSKLGTMALNIGGIANVTIIPSAARPEDVSGFDTGPGNMIMDALVRHLTRGRGDYDAGGRLASRGRVVEPLLRELLRLSFFRRNPPKSAGHEQFGSEFVGRYFLEGRTTEPRDLLRTANELTACSIADALRRFVFRRLKPGVKLHRLIVSGGGAHNRLLMRRLRELLPELSLSLSDDYGLPADAKEAMAFAALADRTMRGLPGNLPGVTGARREVVLGKIVWPAAFGRRRNPRYSLYPRYQSDELSISRTE